MGTITQKIQGVDEKLRGMRGLIEEHAENYKSQAQGKSQEDVILRERLDDLTQKISAMEKELLDMSEYVNLPLSRSYTMRLLPVFNGVNMMILSRAFSGY